MGCYLCITDKQGLVDHPDWDWGIAGGRDYSALYYSLPHEKNVLCRETMTDVIRPTDFAAWREAIKASGLCNQEAHLRLVDLLETDPQWWIYVSW